MKYDYPINIDAIMTEGTCDGSTFAAGSAFTNSELLKDQNIEFGASNLTSGDAIRFDFGSGVTVTPDLVAIYIGTGHASATGVIYRSSDGTNVTSVATISAGDLTSSGWYVKTFTGVAARYYIYRFTGTVSSFVPNEIFFANRFTFPYNYNLGNSYSKLYGVDSVANASGDEFTNKRHASKWVRTWDWRNFSQTNIDDMETFDTAVDGKRAKFLFYDNTKYWWVKQTVGLNYTEAGYLAFDPSSGLRQQLF